jgi:hypothetical protein
MKRNRKKKIWEHWGAWLGAVLSITIISLLRVGVEFPIDNLPIIWVEVVYNTIGAIIGFVIGGGIHWLIREV